MPTIDERTVISNRAGSCLLCLPKGWLRFYGIKPGDKVEVIANGELIVRPLQKKQKRGADNAD